MAGPRRQTRPDGFGRGLGFARYKGTSAYCAVIAEIEAAEANPCAPAVDRSRCRRDHQSRRRRAPDRGRRRAGLQHRAERGRARSTARGITSTSWESYPILRFEEVPKVKPTAVAARICRRWGRRMFSRARPSRRSPMPSTMRSAYARAPCRSRPTICARDMGLTSRDTRHWDNDTNRRMASDTGNRTCRRHAARRRAGPAGARS